MANRNYDYSQTLNKQVKSITGRLDETGAKLVGLGFNTSKTGTGEYTITLDDAYPFLLSATATLQTAATGNFECTIASFDVSASSKTIVLETAVAGVLTDLPASSQIHFSLNLQNSTVPAV